MTDRKALTVNDIEALAPQAKEYRVWDKTDGLCVRVSPKGKKTWSFSYRNRDGNKQTVRIGLAEGRGSLTPGEARKALRSLGDDPAASRRAERAKQQAEQRKQRQAAQRTLHAFLEGDYWQYHLSNNPTGDEAVKRIKAVWGDLLDKDIADIVPLDIERIRCRRLAAGRTPQTVNRDWHDLSALFSSAIERGLIEKAPTPKKKKLKEVDDKRVRYLDDDERERFLNALMDDATEPHLRVLVYLAYFTGGRRGELFNLRWGAVDFALGQVAILASTSKTPKTRYIPLHDTLRHILKEWHNAQGKPGDDVLIVPSPVDGASKLATVRRSWANLCKRAGVQNFTFHCLRHDFASRLVQRGRPLYEVQKLLGHSTITLTERYSHLAPDNLRSAVEAL
jgi:integrase